MYVYCECRYFYVNCVYLFYCNLIVNMINIIDRWKYRVWFEIITKLGIIIF